MAHVLICGITESGKTHLAKSLSRYYRSRGVGVLVLDELCDPGWMVDPENGYQTSDPEDFLDVYWRSRRCMAFIDEAGDAIGHYDKAMIKTATRGRHWGHVNHYITQRGKMISPTVRGQCTKLFCFNMALEDCEVLAREWNKPELLKAASLEQGQYIFAQKMGKVYFSSTGASKNAADSDSSRSVQSDGGPSVAQEKDAGEGGGSVGSAEVGRGTEGSGTAAE